MGRHNFIGMKHLEKGFLGDTQWWKYLLVFTSVIIGVFVFSIPHGVAINIKKNTEIVDSDRLEDLSYLMTLFDSNVNLIYMILPFIGGLIALFLGVKFIHKQSLVNLTTGRNTIDWKRVGFSFSIWSVVVLSFVVVQYLIEPESLVFNFQLKNFLILLFLGTLLVPLQTSFEEYLFRGYLMQSLGVLARNRWFPLAFTSIVFGVMHVSNPEVAKLGYGLLAYYVATGFFLGIITLMDDGMELSLGFHAANNLISALLVTTDWTVFQTYSIFKDVSEPNLVASVLPSLILFPIAIYVYSKKYDWGNWQERLTGVVQPKNEKL